MERTWESLFIDAATEKKHSERYIKKCLDYAKKLHENNLPVIFDIEHLMFLWGNRLDSKLKNFSYFYTDYEIRKKKGGTRTISAPYSTLKWCQEWILKNILDHLTYMLSTNVHGFIKERSIITNAEPHKDKKWIINIDLQDFFGSIKRNKVYSFFCNVGYDKPVAKYLSLICTKFNSEKIQETLPQGAPTSPMLANLLAKKLDEDLNTFANQNDLIYTRYADDLTFSGNQEKCPIRIKHIEKIIYKNGFYPNKSKTRIRHKGQRMEVTGLTVENGIHVSKKYRKEVLKEIHFALKYGPQSHCERTGNKKGYFKEWLLGRIMYIRSVDYKTGNKMLDSFNKINWII